MLYECADVAAKWAECVLCRRSINKKCVWEFDEAENYIVIAIEIYFSHSNAWCQSLTLRDQVLTFIWPFNWMKDAFVLIYHDFFL